VKRSITQREEKGIAMKNITIIIACAVASMSVSHAALDETIQQIQQRYGLPTNVEASPPAPANYAASYQRGDVKIYVTFIGGRSQYKKYSGFEYEDIEKILKANEMGMRTWIEVESPTSEVKKKSSTTSARLRMSGAESAYRNYRGRYWILPGQAAEAHLRGNRSDGYTLEIATDQWLKAKSSGF
jgi:hypothetical protein